MKYPSSLRLRALGAAALAIVVVGVLAAAMLRRNRDQPPAETPEKPGALEVRGEDAVVVSDGLVESLGIRTAPVAAARGRSLEVYGQLVLPQARFTRTRLRFPGRIVQLGKVTDHAAAAEGGTSVTRDLRVGDLVEPGQLLAVVLSADLGAKKSELVDRLTQLRNDERQLKEMRAIPGAMPQRSLWDLEARVAQDRNAVNSAEATLRAWDVTAEEINSLKEEGERLHRVGGELRTDAQFQRWARMEIRAPEGWRGTVLEMNATTGELVDPQNGPALFQLADLSRMVVDAWASEDALRVLDRLPRPMHWSVTLLGEPQGQPLEDPDGDSRGPTFQIMPMIEPNQKSPILRGLVKAPAGRRLAGMPVKATIPLGPPPDELELPASALLDEGERSFVFVQDAKDPHVFRLLPVQVSRRYEDVVLVRRTANGSGQAPSALHAGDRVLSSGTLEVRSEMLDAQERAR